MAAPVGGLLGDAFGYRTLLWVVAAGFLLVGVVLGMSRFRNARLGDVYTHPG